MLLIRLNILVLSANLNTELVTPTLISFQTRSPAVARMADRTAHSRRYVQKLWRIHLAMLSASEATTLRRYTNPYIIINIQGQGVKVKLRN